MMNRLFTRVMHRLQLRESWIIFFILGAFIFRIGSQKTDLSATETNHPPR